MAVCWVPRKRYKAHDLHMTNTKRNTKGHYWSYSPKVPPFSGGHS